MSHNVNKLINCIKNLSDHAVNRLLDIALEILDIETFEYKYNWNTLSGYICALVAEWCLNGLISVGKVYKLYELENLKKFVESIPRRINNISDTKIEA